MRKRQQKYCRHDGCGQRTYRGDISGYCVNHAPRGRQEPDAEPSMPAGRKRIRVPYETVSSTVEGFAMVTVPMAPWEAS